MRRRLAGFKFIPRPLRKRLVGSLQVRHMYVYQVAQQSDHSHPGIDSKRRMKVDHKHS